MAGAVVLAAGLIIGGAWGTGSATAQGSGGARDSSGPTPLVAYADPAGQPANTDKAPSYSARYGPLHLESFNH